MASFGSGTWNTRGLCANCDKSRGRKLAHAEQIIGKTDFAAFQETHGSAVMLVDIFRRHQRDKHVAWSSFDSPEALSLDMQTIPLGSSSCDRSSEKKATQDNNSFFEPSGSSASDDANKGNMLNKGDDSDSNSSSSSSSSETSLYTCKSDHSYSSAASSSCSTRVGGVLNILSKKAFPPGTTFSSLAIVQGRCLETIAEVGGRTSVFININFLIGPPTTLGPLLIGFPFTINVPSMTPCTIMSAFWGTSTLDMQTRRCLMLPRGRPCFGNRRSPNPPEYLNRC